MFYERTKFKQTIAIVCAGLAMMLLGFCSFTAGEAQSAKEQRIRADDLKASDETLDSLAALAAGYGFASAMYIFASLLLFATAIYISPSCCG